MRHATPATRPQAIRVNLTLPVTRIGVGVFSFDPVAHAIGAPLAHVLAPLMVGPVTQRPSVSGPAVEVYPLALPEGEGLAIPLGAHGEIGFANDAGLLALTVPWAASGWVRQRLGDAVVDGPQQRQCGAAWVATFRVRLRAGMRASWPIGGIGEVGVEAA
ncbi:MAG: hypothetical protein H6739_37965 [Alphaproteobacteria bacterium]|nr:hypothetical protein [Alphaproteobacteria bacterium]